MNIAPQSVYNRISRGTFSAAFLLQCLAAIGADQLELDQPDGGKQRGSAVRAPQA